MTRRRFFALLGVGLVLLVLTGLGVYVQRHDGVDGFVVLALGQGAVYLIAIRLVWHGATSRRGMIVILGAAVAMRIVVALAPPFLSTDAYRYVWDGRVIAAGINPYRYVPDDPHLDALRDPAIFPNINRSNYARTIYPPLAEAVFFAVTRASASVTAIKVAMVGFDIVTMVMLLRLLVLAGLPAGRVLVYAWHPLPIWEFAGSGHIDAALIALTTVALWAAMRGRAGISGIALAGATLTKFYPAVLLPALLRRWEWKMPAAFAAALVIGYLPFSGVGWHVLGFLPGYVGEEGFDRSGAGFYLLGLPFLGGLPTLAYIVGAAVTLAALGAAVALRRDVSRPSPTGAMVLATVFMVLLSPHYAWYFAWLIVFVCFIRSLALLWLTNACLLLYLIPVGSHIVRNDHRLAVESIIYGPFAALALADLWYHRHRVTRSS